MRIWIWLLVLVSGQVMASTEELFRQAMAYHEAGAYGEAASAWKEVLKLDLAREESAHARYNLGCAYLADGLWQPALESFAAIDVGKDPSPELVKRLAINCAWAEWSAGGEELDEESDAYREACDSLLRHLQRGWGHYREAVKAQAQVALLEGDDSQSIPKELVDLRRAIKERVADVLAKSKQWRLDHLTLAELLDRLKGSLAASIQLLDTMGRVELSEGQACVALQQMSRAQESLEELWQRTRGKFKLYSEEKLRAANESGDEKRANQVVAMEQAVAEAETLYLQSAEWLAEGNLWKARHSAMLSLRTLQLLAWQEQERDLVEGCLAERIAVRNRIDAAPEGSRLEAAIMAEEREWTGLAQQICGALLEQIEVSPSEDAELLRALHQRLFWQNDLSVARARQDLCVYQALGQEPVNLVQTLRHDVKLGNESPERWSEQIVALQERFAARDRVEPQENTERVVQLLEAARGQTQPDRLAVLLDQVLKECDLRAFAKVRLEDARDHCSDAAKAPHLEEHGVDTLRQYLEAVHALLVDEESLEAVLPDTDRARRCTHSAGDEIEEGRTACAQAFLADSAQSLDRAMRALDAEEQTTAAVLLQEGISEQSHARRINQRIQQAARTETIGRSVAQMVCGTEEQVLSVVNAFEESLAAEEGLSDQTVEEVLALFHEGLGDAQLAKEHLALARPEWKQALERQQVTEQFWKEALEKLQDPDDGQDQGGDGGGGEGDGGERDSGHQEDEQEGESEPQEQNSDTAAVPTQIFEWLQQMDDEDGPMEQRRTPPRKGLRPW